MRCGLAIAGMLACGASVAQSSSTLMGARATGMAYASSTLNDEWSLFNNPAGLASLTETGALFAYEARPALQGTNRAAAGINVPLGFGTTSLGLFRFGDELYSEQAASLAFANQFGIASLGLRLTYVQYRTQGFGTTGALSLTFGGRAAITDQLTVGAYMMNLNQAEVNDEERIPTLLIAGISFRPVEALTIATEVEKDLDYPLTWKTAAEYTFKNKFFARTGFNLWPQSGFFGVGFKKSRLQLDYAAQVGTSTGNRHMASASYSFMRKAK